MPRSIYYTLIINIYYNLMKTFITLALAGAASALSPEIEHKFMGYMT